MIRQGTADYVSGQIEDFTGIRKNSQYQKHSYTRDCIAILMVAGRLARGEPSYDLPFTSVKGQIIKKPPTTFVSNTRRFAKAAKTTGEISSYKPIYIIINKDSFHREANIINECQDITPRDKSADRPRKIIGTNAAQETAVKFPTRPLLFGCLRRDV